MDSDFTDKRGNNRLSLVIMIIWLFACESYGRLSIKYGVLAFRNSHLLDIEQLKATTSSSSCDTSFLSAFC